MKFTFYTEHGTQFLKSQPSAYDLSKIFKKVYEMKPQMRRKMEIDSRQWALENYSIETNGEKIAKFIVFKPLEMVNGVGAFMKRSLLSANYGTWKDRDLVIERFGLFFKNIRGPIYKFVDQEVVWDRRLRAYRWGEVYQIPEGLAWFRSYYFTFYILRNICLSVIIFSFPREGAKGNVVQLALLVALLLFHAHCVLFIVVPFNSKKDQLVNYLTNSCEFGTYFSGLMMILYPGEVFEQMLLAFQLGSIFVQILGQIWGVIIILAAVGKGLYLNVLTQKQSKKERDFILGKRYIRIWRQNMKGSIRIELY
jgi:hypothetical protein